MSRKTVGAMASLAWAVVLPCGLSASAAPMTTAPQSATIPVDAD